MDGLYNTKQAAEYLGISKAMLDKFRMEGTGPKFFRLTDGVNAPCFYLKEDLDAYVTKRHEQAKTKSVHVDTWGSRKQTAKA